MRLEIAKFFGTLISFTIWGFYTCLFIVTIWIVRLRRPSNLWSPMVISVVLIYTLNVIMSGFMFVSMYNLLIGNYSLADRPHKIVQTLADTVYILILVLGDAIVAYRLYNIWSRDIRMLAFSLVSLTAIAGTGFTILAMHFNETAIDPNAWHDHVLNVTEAQTWITLAYNWIVTCLICGRLWGADRRLKKTAMIDGPPRDYMKIIRVFVESGAFYSIFFLAYIIAGKIGDGYSQILFDCSLCRIIGIVPTLILLQRTLGFLQPSETDTRGAREPVSIMEFAAQPSINGSCTMADFQFARAIGSETSTQRTILEDYDETSPKRISDAKV